jgi:hypothetical protein
MYRTGVPNYAARDASLLVAAVLVEKNANNLLTRRNLSDKYMNT